MCFKIGQRKSMHSKEYHQKDLLIVLGSWFQWIIWLKQLCKKYKYLAEGLTGHRRRRRLAVHISSQFYIPERPRNVNLKSARILDLDETFITSAPVVIISVSMQKAVAKWSGNYGLNCLFIWMYRMCNKVMQIVSLPQRSDSWKETSQGCTTKSGARAWHWENRGVWSRSTDKKIIFQW